MKVEKRPDAQEALAIWREQRGGLSLLRRLMRLRHPEEGWMDIIVLDLLAIIRILMVLPIRLRFWFRERLSSVFSLFKLDSKRN